MRISQIRELLRILTQNYVSKKSDNETYLNKLTGEYISKKLGIKRNTASYYLNQLWDEKFAIKINTRPVYFLDKFIIEEKYGIRLEKVLFSDIDELKEYANTQRAKEQDPFSRVIGFDGSLYSQIERCKAAVAYPPNGLPALITGPTGAGKSYFAQLMYEYAVEEGILSSSAPFIILNCAEYVNNPELLTGNLFGYVEGAFTGAVSDRTGLIEEADGGILFLDEVHRLPPEGQEKLFLFMDKGIFRRLGQSSGWRQSTVRFIFATTEEPKDVFIDTFLRRIPITVAIPPLFLRGYKEKYDLICKFLLEEAKNLNKAIKVSGNVLNILLNYKFIGNIGQLKNVIKSTCAEAFINDLDEENNLYLNLNLNYLPSDIIETNLSTLNDVNFSNIKRTEGLIAYPNGEVKSSIVERDNFVFEDLYNDIYDIYMKLDSEEMDKKSFITTSLGIMDVYFDKFFFDTNQYIDVDIKFNVIRKVIDSIFQLIKKNYGLKFYGNTVLIFSYYIYLGYRFNSKKDTNKLANISDEVLSFLKKSFPKEYIATEKLINQIETNLDIKIREEDKIIFNIYIKGINKNFDANRIRALILAHGYSTASSIANVANRLLGQYIFEAFDMPIDSSIEELAKKVKHYVKNVDTTKGIIILVDMGSLEKIYAKLENDTVGVIGIINNITTQLALDVGSKIMREMDIEDIVKRTTENNRSNYKIIRPRKKRKKAILTTCITGIGTANKIKKLLEESVGDYLQNLSIISSDFTSLKNEKTDNIIFKEYEVLMIVGTVNPQINSVPFVALEDLISGNNKECTEKIVSNIFDQDILNKINQNLIRVFSLQSVIKHLTILNPDRIISDIEEAINQLERLLGKEFSNETKISLYVHLSCLIERLITKDPIETYNDIYKFERCQKKFIKSVKKSFSVIEDKYSVNMPTSEVGYIYDIIKFKTEEFNT